MLKVILQNRITVMLCLDRKISFQILDLDEIYCLDGMEFEIIEFVQIPIIRLVLVEFKIQAITLSFEILSSYIS